VGILIPTKCSQVLKENENEREEAGELLEMEGVRKLVVSPGMPWKVRVEGTLLI
jgi:hypothetical protein